MNHRATISYRLGLGLALLTALFLLFGIGALGIIGSGGPADLLYVGAIAVGLFGAVLARGRAGGMALALAATAGVTLLVGAVAVGTGVVDREGGSVGDVLMLSVMYACLFALSAWFFWRSAEPAGASGRPAA